MPIFHSTCTLDAALALWSCVLAEAVFSRWLKNVPQFSASSPRDELGLSFGESSCPTASCISI